MRRFAIAALLLGVAAAAGSATAAGAAAGATHAPGAANAPGVANAPAAADTTVLGHYLQGLTSLRADFSQTVTDAHGAEVDHGTGSLALLRPGHFRWDYHPAAAASGPDTQPGGTAGATASGADQADSGELLVADGRNLWYYDRELAQVTVRPLAAGLSMTPIMLLTGSSSQLDRYFEVMADGSAQGLSWVLVKPRSEQAGFTDARLGFQGQTLVRMVFHDMVGQSVRLDFSHSERNVHIDAVAFDFKVPKGVDVIGKPLN